MLTFYRIYSMLISRFLDRSRYRKSNEMANTSVWERLVCTSSALKWYQIWLFFRLFLFFLTDSLNSSFLCIRLELLVLSVISHQAEKEPETSKIDPFHMIFLSWKLSKQKIIMVGDMGSLSQEVGREKDHTHTLSLSPFFNLSTRKITQTVCRGHRGIRS